MHTQVQALLLYVHACMHIPVDACYSYLLSLALEINYGNSFIREIINYLLCSCSRKVCYYHAYMKPLHACRFKAPTQVMSCVHVAGNILVIYSQHQIIILNSYSILWCGTLIYIQACLAQRTM